MRSASLGYVLLVEDDPDICTLYQLILESEGYRVACAHDGFEALCRLQFEPGSPRLVILDLHMPGTDGFEFRRMKAKFPEFDAIPIVVVSAAADCADFYGVRDVKVSLTKPVDMARLLAEVKTWAGAAPQ